MPDLVIDLMGNGVMVGRVAPEICLTNLVDNTTVVVNEDSQQW